MSLLGGGRRFLAELKRRSVIRVGVAYIVVAFALLQGADLVLPALLLPDWTFRLLVLLVLFLFPIVLVLSWIYDLTPEGVQRTAARILDNDGIVETPPASPPLPVVDPDAPIDSVAILPLVARGGDEDSEYLADGITEAVINKMSSIPGLRVVPRASAFRLKGRDLDPTEIGRELGVRALVMGRLTQRGDTLVVQAELVDLLTRSQLWGDQYSRPQSDIFALQEDMSEEITRALRLQLTSAQRDKLLKRETHDPAAYREYMRGRHAWNKRTGEAIRRAVAHFQRAIDLDPNFALVYAGLADAYDVLGYYNIQSPHDTYPRAKAAAARALSLDPELAEAHASLGYALLFYDRAYEEAAQELRKATVLNPGYATAHQWYGWYLLVHRRFEEMVEALALAVQLDPLSLIINDHYGYALFLAGRYRDARRQIERTLELDGRYALAYQRLGNLAYHEGDLDAAITALEQAVEHSGGSLARGYLGQALGVAGRTGEARGILSELRQDRERSYVSPLDLALVHSGLGEIDETLDALDQAFEDRTSDLIRLELLHWPEELRVHPRFEAMVQAVAPGMPELMEQRDE